MNKPITFQNSISNEEAALLPAIEFRGPIVVVDSEPRLREACRYLAAQPVIGFDTETRPSFRAGVVNRVALLQLSSPEQSFLFRLCKIPLDKAIVKILENKEILKIGADVKGDLRALHNIRHFQEAGARRRVGHRREKPAQTFGDRTRPAGIQSPAPEQLGSRTTHRQAAVLRRNGRLGLHAYLRPAAAHTQTKENEEMIPQIHLRRGKEESLLRRHPWIFSGAIESVRYDGNEIPEGALVYTRSGDFIARGHYQIGSIAVRVLTFEQEPIDAAWWQRMISTALDVRRTLGLTDAPDTTCYRLVHGEGDSLPGLVVDIYDTTAVIQCHSVGMYHARLTIADAIRTVYGDRITAIYDKSSQTVPFKAGLNPVDGYLYGKTGGMPRTVLENGEKFLVNWEEGQKTGFFIDQRFNRELVRRYARGRTVLNTFCYTGGFSVYALAGGAREVCSIDSSERAVALADANVRLNFGEEAPHTSLAVDAVEYLKDIGDRYDMIILDPPAFAKHHKVLGNAMQGYKRLNARALAQIKSGGLLFTFSCSQAVSKELFRTTVFSAAAIAGRKVRILHQLTQPADHPINIYHPEGEYLKGLVLYVE